MPKGKPRAKNPELYQYEDLEAKARRSKAPQAAPHRRGGAHRVKDEHRTGTHWDDKNYVELIIAAKDAGVWRKDMVKWRMAQELARKDRDVAMLAKRMEMEVEKKKREIEEQKEKGQTEKERLKKEKRARRQNRRARAAAGEDVSSESESGSESSTDHIEDYVGVGQILSEEDEWSSTTSPTSTHVSMSPIFPAQKLRIFEWANSDPPPNNPPLSPISPSGRIREEVTQEPLPTKIPYAVMNVVTTLTGETLELPGLTYSEGVGSDFVPMLSEHTKDCARNGVLVGHLGMAVVERGSDWAARTQVQYWNGRMYLKLPRRRTKAALKDVYAKWNAKKTSRSMAKRSKSMGITKYEPSRKAAQRLKEKREKMLDVYAASEFRPQICYVASYLDYPFLDDEEVEKSIDNLFYIRFPGMALPHYYFWAVPEEWDDPTIPNPEWLETEVQQTGHNVQQGLPNRQLQHNRNRRGTQPETGIDRDRDIERVMVRRTPVPRTFEASATPPKSSKYKAALWTIERDLYQNGWANTMYVLRDKWIKGGKEDQWMRLISRLPAIYPSGNLPTSPPVQAHPKATCLAEKFAAIEIPRPQRPVEPITGDEAWTRDDAAYWNVVHEDVTTDDVQDGLLRMMSSPTSYALNRRNSEVLAWRDDVSSFIPLPPAPIPVDTNSSAIRAAERAAWEALFLQVVEAETALASEIEQMPVAQLRHDLYTLMNESRRRSVAADRCKICLEPLDPAAALAHYETHHINADDVCPFCSMPWRGFDSTMKATHIFCHDVDESPHRRRRPSNGSPGLGTLAAVPKTKKRKSINNQESIGRELAELEPRRMSKVSFSPVTVERRIAYNDVEDDAGIEADISSIATSPRRSSICKTTKPATKPRKSALKIDTSAASTRITRQSKFNNSKNKGTRRKNFNTVTDTANHEYAPSHSNSEWSPRRASRSSLESLEFYTGKRGPRKRIATEASSATKGTKGKRTSKGKEKIDEQEYEDLPSSASTYDPIMIPKKRGKVKDPSYRDTLPSPPSSGSISPILTKRKRARDSTYRNQASPPSPSTADKHPVKRRKIKAKTPRVKLFETPKVLQQLAPIGDGQDEGMPAAPKKSRQARIRPKRASTVKSKKGSIALDSLKTASVGPKASSASKKRKNTVLDDQPKTRSATASSKNPSAKCRVSPKTEKSKVFEDSAVVLNRRSSSIADGHDFISFIDEPLLEDREQDVLTRNPFASSHKKKNTPKTGTKKSSAATSKSNRKATRNSKAMRKAVGSKGLASRRIIKSPTKKTILGRTYVEPLVIAPARRLSKPRENFSVSTPAQQSNTSVPPTPSSHTISPTTSKKAGVSQKPNAGRERRSSAPTPSPSLVSLASTRRASSNSTKSQRSPTSLGTIVTQRKASYDVGFSEPRPIVPPNTPAIGLLKRRKGEVIVNEEETGSETPLDAGKLSDKIGKVKTTRRGLVRELPITVEESVLGKPKPRGRSVSKKKNNEKKGAVAVKNISTLSRKLEEKKEKAEKIIKPRRRRMSEVEALAALKPVEKGRDMRVVRGGIGKRKTSSSAPKGTKKGVRSVAKKSRIIRK